jgi:hypothetical protein
MHFSPLQACSDKAICVWEMVIHTNISERPLAMAPATLRGKRLNSAQ